MQLGSRTRRDRNGLNDMQIQENIYLTRHSSATKLSIAILRSAAETLKYSDRVKRSEESGKIKTHAVCRIGTNLHPDQALVEPKFRAIQFKATTKRGVRTRWQTTQLKEPLAPHWFHLWAQEQTQVSQNWRGRSHTLTESPPFRIKGTCTPSKLR